MAYDINEQTLVGNIAADPTYRTFPDGGQVFSARVLTTRKSKDDHGQPVEFTTGHTIVARNKTAEFMNNSLKKGSRVFIKGETTHRKYTHPETQQDAWACEIFVKSWEEILTHSAKQRMLGQPAPSGYGNQGAG